MDAEMKEILDKLFDIKCQFEETLDRLMEKVQFGDTLEGGAVIHDGSGEGGEGGD